MDVLCSACAMTTGFLPADASAFAIAVSPVQDFMKDVTASPQAGAKGHWPLFPPPDTNTPIPSTTDPTKDITATWRDIADGPDADLDVIVTIRENALPSGAHVRLFPRQFIQIDTIGESPSFVRGDGGSAIVIEVLP